MKIEKPDEVNLLKKVAQEVVQQSKKLNSDNRRLEHLIEFLKGATDVFELTIALLSLNISIEKMYQVIFG